MSSLWIRFFKNREGFYDAAALVDNPNLNAGISDIKYSFKLYDANNILIAAKDGNTFINPGEQQLIFESNISTGPRTPARAFIEFSQPENWKYIKKEKSFLSVVKKDFVNLPFPRLTAEIRNDSLFDTKDVIVSAILYDESGNAQGVSSTKIDLIGAGLSETAAFTWPQSFEKEPVSIEVIATTNLTINNNH